MKVYRIKKIPEIYSPYFESAEFDEYDLSELEKLGADVVFYWYAKGYYEGSGQILFLLDGKWYLHDAGHCSCFGPTDNINLREYYNNLEELLKHCSDEYKEQILPLIELAKKKGYK